MKDGNRPVRRLHVSAPLTIAPEQNGALEHELGRLRAGIVRALEAIEDGDLIEARAILHALDEPLPRLVRCPFCEMRFQWPGLLDRHLAISHREAQCAA